MLANVVSTSRKAALSAVLLSIVLWAPLPALASDGDDYEKLTATQKQSIIEKVAQVISENYVEGDKGIEMAALIRRALEDGDYDGIEYLPEFCRKITHDLHQVSNDLHLKVSPYRNESHHTGEPDSENDLEQTLQTWRKQNFGFNKVELLDGNIGYIDLRFFSDAQYGGPTAMAAMNLVAYCDALIMDLRANVGGQPSMIQLICSYFFDSPTYLGGFYLRENDSIMQFWTQPFVRGPRLTNVPVYVLVSEKTFSGGEGFAYVLKDLQRVTIVGDTTAGGANPQMPHLFPEESIIVNVPFGKAVSPISKDNWEGKGVVPDILVPASEALEVAQLKALRVMLDRVDDEDERRSIRKIIQEIDAKRKRR